MEVTGLDLYDGDSAGATDLTGSIAMSIMREEGIDEVLTTDPAFSRAGFRVLMEGPSAATRPADRRD